MRKLPLSQTFLAAALGGALGFLAGARLESRRPDARGAGGDPAEGEARKRQSREGSDEIRHAGLDPGRGVAARPRDPESVYRLAGPASFVADRNAPKTKNEANRAPLVASSGTTVARSFIASGHRCATKRRN